MIEIKPIVELKIIIETLTRMGIANKTDKILYPSCYLYNKGEKYFIIHFKEFYKMKNGYDNFTEEDNKRTIAIVSALNNWGLLTTDIEIQEKCAYVYIIPYKEKFYWKIQHKVSEYERTQIEA